MIRILKEDKVRLSYIPRVLVHMFHGEESASTGGLKSYLASFGEGMRALRENHMPHPFYYDTAPDMHGASAICQMSAEGEL